MSSCRRKVKFIPCPHFKISIRQRSKGQSAVAGAAYQSGDRLFSEYDRKYKDYRQKHGIMYTEILLPSNAPPEYQDRQTLWNAAERAEKQWNAQLARGIVLALSRELSYEQYVSLVREYCMEQFVSKGMCCDFAIHDPDPPGHNPHCHIMLTMRAMDEHGKWLPKSRKVYDLDENGERIRLPSGNWKTHKENTVDWNEQYHGEQWRHAWEVIQNRYLEMAGCPERVDLRSYERQGLDIAPTVHMGPAVTQMEKRGMPTNIGNLNRDIRSANRLLRAIQGTIDSLRDWISKLHESKSETIAEMQKAQSSTSIALLLNDYLMLRKEERRGWSRYGQQKGTNDDLKAVAHAITILQDREIDTLDDLDAVLQEAYINAKCIGSEMKKAEKRMQIITGIQKAVDVCSAYKDVHDKYMKIGWKTQKAAFAERHKDELECYNKAYRYLKKHGADLNVDLNVLRAEYDSLEASRAESAKQLAAIHENVKPLKDVRYWIGKVLTPEKDKVEPIPEPKHSVLERLRHRDDPDGQNQPDASANRRKEQTVEH